MHALCCRPLRLRRHRGRSHIARPPSTAMRALQAAPAAPPCAVHPSRQHRRPAAHTARHHRRNVAAPRRAAPPSRDEAEGSLTWRYEWDDEGAVLASKLRAAFLANISRGEAGIDVAEAALLISAEDDALMSVTGVPLPVEPYLARISAMADELAPLLPPDAEPDAVIAAVEAYLWERQRFRAPSAPAIGAGVRVDHPGVYEEPRLAYLNCLLTRRVGSPATLAVLYAALWRLLLARGAVAFAARVVLPRSAVELPQAVPLAQGGALASAARFNLNAWPAVDALADMLRQLKRSYWPWAWDTALDAEEDGPCGSGGGFLASARAALNVGEEDAATTAIARTAAHRLARGVWTSSGAGDLRRARAAAERLVSLLGDAAPRERRDLGVVLLHCGELGAARRELSAFAASPAAASAAPPERKALDALLAALPAWEAEATAAGPPPARRKSLPW